MSNELNINVPVFSRARVMTEKEKAKTLDRTIIKVIVSRYNDWNDVIVKQGVNEYSIPKAEKYFNFANYPNVTLYMNIEKQVLLDTMSTMPFTDITKDRYSLFYENVRLKGYLKTIDEVEYFIPTEVLTYGVAHFTGNMTKDD